MSFTSPQFLLFLILVVILNQLLRPSYKPIFLLIANCLFLGFFNWPSLIVVVAFSSFNYFIGSVLGRSKNKTLFYTSIIINCLGIVSVNYVLAFGGHLIFSLAAIDFKTGSPWIILGLSFYNLQHIAYTIDVYKKRIQPSKNYLIFLAASTYFPKLISGPVTLYQELKPQLHGPKTNNAMLWSGFNRILLGFFKKLVIADRLAPSVSSIFDYNDYLPGLTVLVGGLLFTIQLYFDFSGYCDIAIGASRMLGIVLPENFDFPLRSGSITVFWRKWHQSLIRFYTNYIFYPISFKYRRLNKHAAAIAITVTFLISGLWHGIGFTFFFWALCHLFYLLFELYFGTKRKEKSSFSKKLLSIVYVIFLVSFSNIFFRATDIASCGHLMSEIFSLKFFPDNWLVDFVAPISVGGHQIEHFNFMVILFFVGMSLVFERKIFSIFNSERFNAVATFLMLLSIFLFGVFDSGQRFIYVQF